MCTLSWQWHTEGYELWFSRDESVDRPLARPPEPLAEAWALAPTDPQGGGTWLAVNRAGLSYALLNAYELNQTAPAEIPLTSRGTLIPLLWHCLSETAIEQTMRKVLGAHFAPFRLVVLWPEGRAAQWCWQGKVLVQENARAPVVSSGRATEEVQRVRETLYGSMQNNLSAFHGSHWPERGYRSVCMHRPEAHTVSLSRIQVQADMVQMHYQAGAPCDGGPWQSQTLKREGH